MQNANNASDDPLRLKKIMDRIAARDFRLACPGTPDSAALSAFCEFPGVPSKAQISRWRNGHEYAPLNRLYRWIAACAYLGVPKAIPMRLVGALRSAIEIAYATIGPEVTLEEVMRRASDADLAEEPAEREAWRCGLSVDALRSYRPRLLEQVSTSMELDAAISRHLADVGP